MPLVIKTTLYMLAPIALVGLAACGRSAQAPGMDARNLSDDRGAKAGRFLPPVDNRADATGNAADPANESTS
ncbi:hypothetical protein [Sphingomonas bacterium]|uniref:hypothetical protein n=1 Tax=Sphingomonas bacterium TaxID=1895847 RepID=UPI0015761C17|nr:hypothetical protein [Sphingomonas bacterium]